MAVKIILAVAAIAAGTLIGHFLGSVYKRRQRYFAELCLFCGKLKCEIGFSHKKLAEIVFDSTKTASRELSKNFNEFLELVNNHGETNEQILMQRLSTNDLKADEKKVVAQFFATLGKSDATAQTELIDSFLQRFEAMETAAAELCKKYRGMHTKLGIIAGAAIAVLIV